MGIALIATIQAGKIYYLSKQWKTAADIASQAMLLGAGLASTAAMACIAAIGMGY